MKRTNIVLRKQHYEPSVEEHEYHSSITSKMIWSCICMMIFIVASVQLVTILSQKALAPETTYNQCTSSCAKTGGEVMLPDPVRAQCITSCNNFYMNQISSYQRRK